jgi:four helix bundle protein
VVPRRKFNGAKHSTEATGYRGQKTEDRSQMIKSFEDLEVFQRAYKVSLEIHRLSMEFPKREQYGLADQVRRASKSICANIAEGFAKQHHSKAEFKRYLIMAIGSSDEMRVWLRYCLDLSYITEDTWNSWRDEYKEISKMLQGVYRSWE